MKYQIGDKVKFLNDVGGGIITKIISPTMVYVAIEEGFEYPVSTAEIIPAVQNESGGSAFNTHFDEVDSKILSRDANQSIEKDDAFERETPLLKFTSINTNKNGLYLAFVPQDQVWLLKDNIDIFIVNKTKYDILFSLFLKNQNEYNGIDYGSVSPSSKYFIATISREEINDWNNGLIQVLFHGDKVGNPPAPLNSSFQIKSSRFVSKDSFVPSSFMEEKSILYFLGEVFGDNYEKTDVVEIEKIDFQASSTTASIIHKESVLSPFMHGNSCAEVDLHIESIIANSSFHYENPGSLDSIQILQIQLSHFERCLDEAINLKLRSIVFIHGVGIGKLKSEIRKILNNYPDVHYMDASTQKFGSGAIEVLIK